MGFEGPGFSKNPSKIDVLNVMVKAQILEYANPNFLHSARVEI